MPRRPTDKQPRGSKHWRTTGPRGQLEFLLPLLPVVVEPPTTLPPAALGEKRCPSCQISQPTTNYRAYGRGYRKICLECLAKRGQWRANKPIVGNTQVKSYYRLMHSQRNCCAICHCPETLQDDTGAILALAFYANIDKEIRVLLCRACSLGLSAFRNSARILQSAVTVLTQLPPHEPQQEVLIHSDTHPQKPTPEKD